MRQPKNRLPGFEGIIDRPIETLEPQQHFIPVPVLEEDIATRDARPRGGRRKENGIDPKSWMKKKNNKKEELRAFNLKT